MKIDKVKAVKLFVALGLKNADKWNDARMAAKLGKVNEMVDEDVTLEPEEAETLVAVRAVITAGEEFEVEGTVKPAGETPTVEGEAATVDDSPEKAAEKAAAKAAKEAEREAAKAAKLAEKKLSIAPGTRPAHSRKDCMLPRKVGFVSGNWEYACQMLVQFGIPEEVNEEMCNRFDELRGRINEDAVWYISSAAALIKTFAKLGGKLPE